MNNFEVLLDDIRWLNYENGLIKIIYLMKKIVFDEKLKRKNVQNKLRNGEVFNNKFNQLLN